MKVAVLKGGPSAEREVSLRSGAAVARGLRDAGHEVEEVDVVNHELQLPDDCDVAFIALHGEFGEDGGVQAILESRGIPYTGSDAESSRLAFDKILTKKIFIEKGIPTPSYEVLKHGDVRTLPFPVVIKPACQGSSIGVYKVSDDKQWAEAVKDAFSYGPELLVEEYVKGRELTVGVVDGEVLPVIEIEAPDHWYDYQAKYTAGACNYIVPANINEGVRQICQELALRTFEVLGCSGVGRVDLLADESGGVYVLELNSIPGFTETSLLPKAAAQAGMHFSALCDRIVRSSLSRR